MWPSQPSSQHIAEKGYDLHTLAAFSGSLTAEDGESVTEVSVNGVSDVGRAFREQGLYRVLIVANKFQTGFDDCGLSRLSVAAALLPSMYPHPSPSACEWNRGGVVDGARHHHRDDVSADD